MYYSQQPDPKTSMALFVIIISYYEQLLFILFFPCLSYDSFSPHIKKKSKRVVKRWIKFLPLLLEMVTIYPTASFRKKTSTYMAC